VLAVQKVYGVHQALDRACLESKETEVTPAMMVTSVSRDQADLWARRAASVTKEQKVSVGRRANAVHPETKDSGGKWDNLVWMASMVHPAWTACRVRRVMLETSVEAKVT